MYYLSKNLTILEQETAYVHDSTKSNTDTSVIRTHPKFPTLYTVETFMRLNENKELKSILPENNIQRCTFRRSNEGSIVFLSYAMISATLRTFLILFMLKRYPQVRLST